MSHYKLIYAPAAEVMGMVLAYLEKSDTSEQHKEWFKSYTDYLYHMLTDMNNRKQDQFIVCVHKIQLHYSGFTKRYSLSITRKNSFNGVY